MTGFDPNSIANGSEMTVNGRAFTVLSLLGRGKGGYSYLVTDGEARFVLKQLHHEPCDYYAFGDKLQSERNDYARLSAIGVPMPQLIDIDESQERILKEYIDGPTAAALAEAGRMLPAYIRQIEDLCERLYAHNTNIDYYPTNFVLQDGTLFYVDYECNDYMPEWDFEHWGKQYWINKGGTP